MKKNLILMTALFAGSMIVNDGFGFVSKKTKPAIQSTTPASHNPMQFVAPNNNMQRDEEQEDEELPAEKKEQLEQEQVRNLQTQLTKTQDKLTSTQQELESAQKAKEELEAKVKELEESKKEIQAQLSQKAQELTTSNNKSQKLQEQLKKQGADLEDAKFQLKTKENELKKLQQEQQELKQKYNELETRLAELKKLYSGLEDERTTLAAQVNLITKQLPQINILLKNVLGKSVTTGDLLTNITDDGLDRQIAILHAYADALQKLHTDDGIKKEMSTEDQKHINKFIKDLHTLNKDVGTYTKCKAQKNDKEGIDSIYFEIGQLQINIATLLTSYKDLFDKYSQITAQASVKVKEEKPHPADERQHRYEEFTNQNKKSYWIPGWVKTIGVVVPVLAKLYQNYSVTVPATPGTNSLGKYGYNATNDIIWNRDTGSMLYPNGTKYQFEKWDMEQLNATYPNVVGDFCAESQESPEPQGTSWFSWVQTDNKPNKGELCKNYYEEGIKNGTATMKEELKKLKIRNSELNTNNTALQNELDKTKKAKTAAEQNAETTNKALNQCEDEKEKMYTEKEYDAHYRDGINEGKAEKKCPNTGSKISEEDQKILNLIKERKARSKQLDEEIKASSIFSFQSKYLWEKIKLHFFYF